MFKRKRKSDIRDESFYQSEIKRLSHWLDVNDHMQFEIESFIRGGMFYASARYAGVPDTHGDYFRGSTRLEAVYKALLDLYEWRVKLKAYERQNLLRKASTVVNHVGGKTVWDQSDCFDKNQLADNWDFLDETL